MLVITKEYLYLYIINSQTQKINAMKTMIYKGFKVTETMQEGGATTAVAYLNGQVMFGTFSHVDTLTAFEKMIVKINSFLNK